MNRLACIVLASLAACSVLPEQRHPIGFEHDVSVFYDLGAGDSDLRVPASRDGLTVLELRTEPPVVSETFAAGQRRLHTAGDTLTVHCRYRLFHPLDGTGAEMPLPTPEQLFPGATSIRRLDPIAK